MARAMRSRSARTGRASAGLATWVIPAPEVLSPGTAATERAEKLPIHAGEHVGHVWLIDPILRTLEVHRLDGATYRTIAVWRDDAVARAEPFDAVDLELGALWET